MQRLLCGGGAAPAQRASLFKCEILGRFRILSILLTLAKRTGFTRAPAGERTVFLSRKKRGWGGVGWGRG